MSRSRPCSASIARNLSFGRYLTFHLDARLSRLIKTPKLHIGDTGLAATLLGLDAAALHQDRTALGPLLETFVFQELRRQASWQDDAILFHHFRDNDGAEVDVVLERSGHVAGVEVKASSTVTPADFRGLTKLRLAAGKRFAGGVVLYDGEVSVGFGESLYAVPIRRLWESAGDRAQRRGRTVSRISSARTSAPSSRRKATTSARARSPRPS